MKQDTQSHDELDSEDHSSSSEEDENAELLTDEVEERFFKVLSRLKKKDPKLYEESERFFPGSVEEEAESDLTQEEKEKRSHDEYREWLKGQRAKLKNKKVKEELEALHDFWTNPTINKDEQFLRDYILNKKFLEPDDNFNIEEEINKLSDEEKEVEEQLLFEHKYNTRFENPDQEPVTRLKPKKSKKVSKDIPTVENDDRELEQNISIKAEIVEKEELPTTEIKERKKKELSGKEEIVEVKKLKLRNNLPRNLQLKNLKSIKKRKTRHRNRKKEMINGVREQKDGKIEDKRVGLELKKLGKKIGNSENPNKHGGVAKFRKRHKMKKNKHIENLIVKEKKKKIFKFGKMISKKQKASNADIKN